MMKRLMFFVTLLLLTVTSYAQSESTGMLSKQTISAAATHLPSLLRYNGTGEKATIEQISYQAESINNLKNWITEYPNEVSGYLNLVSVYLHDANASTIAATDKDAYYDLKAQWTIINELIKNKS